MIAIEAQQVPVGNGRPCMNRYVCGKLPSDRKDKMNLNSGPTVFNPCPTALFWNTVYQGGVVTTPCTDPQIHVTWYLSI